MHRTRSVPCGAGGGVLLTTYGKKAEVIILGAVISLALSSEAEGHAAEEIPMSHRISFSYHLLLLRSVRQPDCYW